MMEVSTRDVCTFNTKKSLSQDGSHGRALLQDPYLLFMDLYRYHMLDVLREYAWYDVVVRG
jgi:hypothetical protein